MSSSLASVVPKIHLHCHLEGTLRAATFVELAGRHGVPLRYDPTRVASERGDPADPYRFESLQEFLYLFAAVSRALKDPADYAQLAREFVHDALAQNVIYGELFISPSVWTFFHSELDVRATIEAIVTELRRAAPRATFKLLPDVTRNFGPESALATAQAMAAMTDLDVIGISLGGDEARFPAALFEGAFTYARSHGLHCVAHAGESGGAESVRDAIELLGVERIGHGIRALDDSSTVELVASRAIALEICPTSNRRTGAAIPAHPHPYMDLERLGCIVTIDADDPALFETSIGREYEIVEQTAGQAALERYVRNAVHASFAPSGEKKAMLGRIASAIAELQNESRS